MLVNYHPPLLHSISTLFGWVDGQRRNAQLLSSILCLSISTNCMLHQANLAVLIISVLSDGSFQHPGGSNLERKNWICYWSGPSSSINLYKHALPLCYWIMPMFSHAGEYQHVCFSILLFLQILSPFKFLFISFYHILYSLFISFWVSCSALRKFQHQESQAANGNKYLSFEYKSGMDNGRKSSSSDRESQ